MSAIANADNSSKIMGEFQKKFKTYTMSDTDFVTTFEGRYKHTYHYNEDHKVQLLQVCASF